MEIFAAFVLFVALYMSMVSMSVFAVSHGAYSSGDRSIVIEVSKKTEATASFVVTSALWALFYYLV